MSNTHIKSLDELFIERGIADPFETAIQQYLGAAPYADTPLSDVERAAVNKDFDDIVESQFPDGLVVPNLDPIDDTEEQQVVGDELIVPDVVMLPGEFAQSVDRVHSEVNRKKQSKKFLRRIGRVGFLGGSAVVVAAGVLSLPQIFADSEGVASEKVTTETEQQEAQEPLPSRTETSVANTVATTGAETTSSTTEQAEEAETITTSTTSNTSTTTSTSAPETTVAPRMLTLLESVEAGERTLESIPGTKVGTLSLEGVCLDGIDVSVSHAADPVKHPELLNGFDWNLLNTNPELPIVQEGDYEAARERLNPLYRLIPDETPQQACDIEGNSEHQPRWTRHTAGSQAAKSYNTPAELVPQANIHPNSALPGQVGVTYIQGHRTTESAPFLNLDALLPGQTASFNDGFNTYNYVFVGYETVHPDINIAEVLQKTIDDKNTLIVSTCDEGDDVRLLAKFVQA